MRLVDIEKKLKSTLEKSDLRDREVYDCIYELCYEFLSRGKKLSNANETEEVAYIMSEELYIKLLNGGSIISWLGYISKSYHAYIRMWRKIYCSEIINASDNLELAEAIVSMGASIDNNFEYQRIADRDYIMSIPVVVDEVLRNSRYIKGTKEYINARLSLLLSICSEKYISYGQSEGNKLYTGMLLAVIRDKIEKVVSSSKYCDMTSRMSLLQLFVFENYCDKN